MVSYALSLCRLSTTGCKINAFIHFSKDHCPTAVSVWIQAKTNMNTVPLAKFLGFLFFPVCKHIKGVSLWKSTLHTEVRDILEFPPTYLSHVLRHIGRWLPRMCRGDALVRCDSPLSDLSHWGETSLHVVLHYNSVAYYALRWYRGDIVLHLTKFTALHNVN